MQNLLRFQKFFLDLTHLYREYRALWEWDHVPGGFSWIDCQDSRNSIVSYVRRTEGTDGEHVDVYVGPDEQADHVYVRMNDAMKKALDRVLSHCVATGTDINEVMEPVTLEAANRLEGREGPAE